MSCMSALFVDIDFLPYGKIGQMELKNRPVEPFKVPAIKAE